MPYIPLNPPTMLGGSVDLQSDEEASDDLRRLASFNRHAIRYVPVNGKAATKGLLMALVDFEFEAYEYSMKVDRLELHVEIGGGRQGRAGSQFTAIQRLIADAVGKKVWVEPKSAAEGACRSCTTFKVVIQDPLMDELLTIQDRLREHYGLASYPTIEMLEIAFDTRPKPGRDIEDALRLAIVMLRRHLLPRIEWRDTADRQLPRLTNDKRTCRMHFDVDSKHSIEADSHPDWTFYVGEVGRDHVFYKIYRKQHDQVRQTQDGPDMINLPLEQQVARTEVTLGPTAVAEVIGGKTLADLEANGLRYIREYFQFATPVVHKWEKKAGLLRNLMQWNTRFVEQCFRARGAWWFAVAGKTGTRRRRLKGGKVVYSKITGNQQKAAKGGRLVIHPTLASKTLTAHRRLQSEWMRA